MLRRTAFVVACPAVAAGGLPAQHGHHRPPLLTRRRGVPGVQQLPPPHERARRAGHRVPTERHRLHLPVGFLIGLRRPQPHMQPVRRVRGHIRHGQRDEL